jgi:hypothetical protein
MRLPGLRLSGERLLQGNEHASAHPVIASPTTLSAASRKEGKIQFFMIQMLTADSAG